MIKVLVNSIMPRDDGSGDLDVDAMVVRGADADHLTPVGGLHATVRVPASVAAGFIALAQGGDIDGAKAAIVGALPSLAPQFAPAAVVAKVEADDRALALTLAVQAITNGAPFDFTLVA